jgi:hypothetical protein
MISMDAPERFEQLIAFLTANLPAPVDQQTAEDDGFIFTGGEPPEVVVHLKRSSVVVSEYDGAWQTAYRFVAKPRRVGVLKWDRLPETALFKALEQLIKGAREMRLARYLTCRYCEALRPPEWMHEVDVCVQCAQRMQVH